jgi:hypothetical protein
MTVRISLSVTSRLEARSIRSLSVVEVGPRLGLLRMGASRGCPNKGIDGGYVPPEVAEKSASPTRARVHLASA